MKRNKYSNKIYNFIGNVSIMHYNHNYINKILLLFRNIIIKKPDIINSYKLEKHSIKKYSKLNDLIYNNNFISDDIKLLANLSELYFEYYLTDNISIYLYYIERKPDICLILKIVKLIRYLGSNNDHLTLIIFYGNQRKQLTQQNKITCENVNSGSCIRGDSIMIWREEEFYKVLIHEMIHFVSLDKPDLDYKYNFKFNIKGENSLNESYTEFLAITINSIVASELLHEDIDMILTYEFYFSLFQIAKICNFFGIEYIEDLFNMTKKTKFIQTTSVFSYYIIKFLLLCDWNNFLQNENIDYNKIISNRNCYQLVNEQIKKIKKDDNFIYLTMRMTAIDYI